MPNKPHIFISCKASMHIGKKWSAAHNRRDYDKAKWNLNGHIQVNTLTLSPLSMKQARNTLKRGSIALSKKHNFLCSVLSRE